MAGFDVLQFDAVIDQVKNKFSEQFRAGRGLIENVQKVIIPNGQNSETVPIPAALTATTRVAGGAAGDGQVPDLTDVTITANKEHSVEVRIDRLTKVGTKYEIKDFVAQSAVDALMGSINSMTWDLITTTSVENEVGNGGVTPSIKILNSAEKILFENKVPKKSQLYAIVGGDEMLAWKNSLTVNEDGVLGSGVRATGGIPQAYGINIARDVDRPSDASGATNILLHPYALAVAYRDYMENLEGEQLTQSKDTGLTDITIFAALTGYRNTNGKGNMIEFTIVAEPKLIYAPWIVRMLG